MFRKREVSLLEKSLINEGVDVHSGVGRALLTKMIECGHSKNKVYFDSTSVIFRIYDENSRRCLAVVERPKYLRLDNLREFIILYRDGLGEAKSIKIYSKYDIYGKAATDV